MESKNADMHCRDVLVCHIHSQSGIKLSDIYICFCLCYKKVSLPAHGNDLQDNSCFEGKDSTNSLNFLSVSYLKVSDSGIVRIKDYFVVFCLTLP